MHAGIAALKANARKGRAHHADARALLGKARDEMVGPKATLRAAAALSVTRKARPPKIYQQRIRRARLLVRQFGMRASAAAIAAITRRANDSGILKKQNSPIISDSSPESRPGSPSESTLRKRCCDG